MRKPKKIKSKNRAAIYIILIQGIIFEISILVENAQKFNTGLVLSTGFLVAIIGPAIFLLTSLIYEKKSNADDFSNERV